MGKDWKGGTRVRDVYDSARYPLKFWSGKREVLNGGWVPGEVMVGSWMESSKGTRWVVRGGFRDLIHFESSIVSDSTPWLVLCSRGRLLSSVAVPNTSFLFSLERS